MMEGEVYMLMNESISLASGLLWEYRLTRDVAIFGLSRLARPSSFLLSKCTDPVFLRPQLAIEGSRVSSCLDCVYKLRSRCHPYPAIDFDFPSPQLHNPATRMRTIAIAIRMLMLASAHDYGDDSDRSPGEKRSEQSVKVDTRGCNVDMALQLIHAPSCASAC